MVNLVTKLLTHSNGKHLQSASKFRAFGDESFSDAKMSMTISIFGEVEYIVGTGENYGYLH